MTGATSTPTAKFGSGAAVTVPLSNLAGVYTRVACQGVSQPKNRSAPLKRLIGGLKWHIVPVVYPVGGCGPRFDFSTT